MTAPAADTWRNPFASWRLEADPAGGWRLWHRTNPAMCLYLRSDGLVGCTGPVCRVMGWQDGARDETGRAWERRQPQAANEMDAIRDAFAFHGACK